jgi:hypothetical protein
MASQNGVQAFTATPNLISPRTDEFCCCFDLTADFISSAANLGYAAAGGLATNITPPQPPTTAFLLISAGGYPSPVINATPLEWVLRARQGATEALITTGVTATPGVKYTFKLCRVAGDPANPGNTTFRVTVNGGAEQLLQLNTLAVPSGTIPASLVAFTDIGVSQGNQQVVCDQFCADKIAGGN